MHENKRKKIAVISLYDNNDMIDRLSNLHVNITLKSNVIKQYQSLLKK